MRKKATPAQMSLPERKGSEDAQQRVPTVEAPAGPLREYKRGDGVMMRVSRFDLMAAELGIADGGWRIAELGNGSAALSPTQPRGEGFDFARFEGEISRDVRGWMIWRRLFGIYPVVPVAGANTDDYRTFTREELMAELGLERKQLQEELDRVRGMWSGSEKFKVQSSTSAEEVQSSKFKVQSPGEEGEFEFKDLEILKRHGMDTLVGQAEMVWMVSRLEAMGKMLTHPQVGELVRMLLLSELDLRRIQNRMSRCSLQMEQTQIGDELKELEKRHLRLMEQRDSLAKVYQGQLKAIDEVFPFMKMIAGNVTMKGVFSDAIAAHQEFYSKKSNQLADGIYTATEIQILHRVSVQAPDPQYRVSQIVWLNQARAHLWDPEWKGLFPATVYKKMDAGYRAAVEVVSVLAGEGKTDLTSDDAVKGEYEPVMEG